MNRELVSHNRPIFDQLHPAVYKAAVGLVAWFALAAWILFDHQNDIGLPLAMVSVLLLIAVLLSLVWQKHQMARQRHPEKSHSGIGKMPISRSGAASFAACMR